MEPFTTLNGVVAPMNRVNVDTDQVIPKQFLKRIERTGFGQFLFFDWRFKEDGSLNPDFELNKPGYDFRFSGLKTAVMLEVKALGDDLDARKADVAASFQRAAVDALVGRALKAAKERRLERIVVAGGVGANRLLRAEIADRFSGRVYYPRLEFGTDNGARIAVAGALRLADAGDADEILANARWSLESLSAPAQTD